MEVLVFFSLKYFMYSYKQCTIRCNILSETNMLVTVVIIFIQLFIAIPKLDAVAAHISS